jgi:hypothetical protein
MPILNTLTLIKTKKTKSRKQKSLTLFLILKINSFFNL